MTHNTHKAYLTQALITLALAALATLYLEHSAFDVMVAQTLYLGGGHWLIDKATVLPDLIFYSGIKAVLIAFEVCLIGLFLYRHYQQKRSPKPTADTLFSQTELGYLLLTMLLVPLVVGALKAVTHVACPAYLQLFGGELPYLPLWQSMMTGVNAKCFPAVHTSSGFALYALAFVPSLVAWRVRIMVAVSVLAWLMGGYKMVIGDHFFSHTVVSMLLAWAICAVMAVVFFRHDKGAYSRV